MGSSAADACSEAHEQAACTYQLPLASFTAALSALWREGKLCDVHLEASDGSFLPAHRLVLVACSGYFSALFTGAGVTMCGAHSQHGQHGQQPQHGQQGRVSMRQYSRPQLGAVLEVMYQQRAEVHAGNVAELMEMGSYLQIPSLVDACCQYLRCALSVSTCIDVLLAAHTFQQPRLRADAAAFVAQRLPGLLQRTNSSSSSSGSGRAGGHGSGGGGGGGFQAASVSPCVVGLGRLPKELLEEVLSSEELSVDSEIDVVDAVAEWVLADPAARQIHMAELVSLVELAALPAPGASLPVGGGLEAAVAASPEGQGVVEMLKQMISHGKMVAAAAAVAAATPGGSNAAPTAAALSGGRPLAQGQAWAAGAASSSSSLSGGSSGGSFSAGSSACATSWAPGGAGACSAAASDAAPCVAGGGARAAAPAGLVPQRRRRGYRPSRLMLAGGHDLGWRSLKTVELYDLTSGEWGGGPSLLAEMCFAGSALLGRDAYVVGGAMFSSVVARYDTSASCWVACAPLQVPRIHSGVAAASGALFVLGGRSRVNEVLASVEMLTPNSSSSGAGAGAALWDGAGGGSCWCPAPDMSTPRSALAAAALGGCVYALGGQAGRRTLACMETLDPEAGRWAVLGSSMGVERKYAAAAALSGRVVAVGGMDQQRRRLAAVEALDPREGRWRRLADMQVPRSSCGVAALGDKLYAVGGNAGDDTLLSSVEVYDPAAGAWLPGAPISCGRSGLSVVAL